MPQQNQINRYMKRYIEPCSISLNIASPCSKSYAQRALILSLLACGESKLTNFTPCEDIIAAIEVVRQLGARVTIEGDVCIVKSSFDKERYTPPTIECGESGLLSRITIAIMALYDRRSTVTGHGTLMKRSFKSIERPMRELGAEITLCDHRLPAIISWGIKGGETTIDGSDGSQFLTALLMTLPLTPRGGILHVKNLTSKPYIDMTIEVMKSFGVEIEREGYNEFVVQGNSKYNCTNYALEGDWSSVSTLLVAGALAGEVTITNLNMKSLQADKKIVELLMMAGVSTLVGIDNITTRRSDVKQFIFDSTDCPDLVPAAVALATQANGQCIIKGISRLRNKESDRAETLRSEYAKVGITIDLDDDFMIITPGLIIGGDVSSHGDHRIAMSLAVAALISQDGITIDSSEAVSKSFPSFWEILNQAKNHVDK